MKFFLLRIVRVPRNHNPPAYSHQPARKRLRNHRAVPSIQNPGLLHRDMKRHHGRPSRTRQQNRAWLSHESWPARPINSKRHGPALLEFPPHAQQRPHRSPTARPTHLHKTKFPDNPPRPFPIKTIAAQYPDLQAPPDIGRGKNAAMPKRQNHGTRLDPRRPAIFKRHCQSQRRTDYPNRQKPRPRNQPKQKSLPQRVRPAAVRRCLTRDRRSGSCAHPVIVPCRADTPVRCR